jgi:ribokinase
VIAKLGGDGALLVDDQGEHHQPAFPVSVVDTTAAGDSFNGAFAVALAEGRAPRRRSAGPRAAAALSVSRAGAQPSLPTRAELATFLR